MLNKRTTIFYADDDPDDLELFDDVLREVAPNSTVLTAKGGTDLLRQLDTHASRLPDVIFLDVNMPDGNGFEALEAIRANPSSKDIPVVMLTTSASEHDVDQSYTLGANFFVTKPSSFPDFKKMLSALLGNPSSFKSRSRSGFVLNLFL